MEENTNPLRFETNPSQQVMMKDRKTMELTGIKQIDSFDSQSFLMNTTQGYLLVQGKDLTLGKLDTEKGEVIIKGTMDSFSYINHKKSPSKESIFEKFFR